MSRVFLSYSHVEPDEPLAHFLLDGLSQRGQSVFIDKQMLVGTKWVEEIYRQIGLCDHFVVLISKASIRSDMVRQEIARAHELQREEEGRPQILPVRMDFDGALPYDMAAYLNPIQYARWRSGESFEAILRQIAAAIAGDSALPMGRSSQEKETTEEDLRRLFGATDGAGGAPLPQADPRLAVELIAESGTVRPGSPFYVQRQADEDLLEQILGEGTTTAVKGPRQYGKSSLLARAHKAAKAKGLRSLYLDFQLVGPEQLESLESLLFYLAGRFARGLRAPRPPEDLWNPHLGGIENLTDYLGAAILPESEVPRGGDANGPILILLDEVDAIFDRPYKRHFFGMIRGWHNQRAIEDEWVRLNLVLSHSTEPQLWIDDINQSPFNVARAIRMEPFDRQQVTDLNARHGRPLRSAAEVEGLLQLVGGHPYLVRQALYAMASRGWRLAQLEDEALADNGPFGDHLRLFLWRLRHNAELVDALGEAIHAGEIRQELAFERLRAAGLIRGATRSEARPSFDLYERYFRRHL